MGNFCGFSIAGPAANPKREEYKEWMSKIRRYGLGVRPNGINLKPPTSLLNDKEIVLAAVRRDVKSLRHASPQLQKDKAFILQVIHENGYAIQFVNNDLKKDRDIVRAVEQQFGSSHVSPIERKEYEYWMSKITHRGWYLQHAPKHLRNDKKLVLAAVRNHGTGTLAWASEDCRNDKDIVMAAVRQHGNDLRYASPELQKDRDVVLAALYQSGGKALNFASTEMRQEKKVVLVAVEQDPDMIRFSSQDLKRDRDVLVAAALIDENHIAARNRQNQSIRKIVLSTRFALNVNSGSDATNFTKLFKEHAYIHEGGFAVYAPNAFDKKTCDKNWTDYDHPCRGTRETCLYNNILTEPDGRPTDDCCWRYSFRCQLQEAKDSGGFMLQLVEGKDRLEDAALGDGQRIEQDMARELHVKVFHVYRPAIRNTQVNFGARNVEVVVAEIKAWYEAGCHDMSLCTVGPMYDLENYFMNY